MRVGIVGAGFTGLAAALRLAKKGHSVLVMEKESEPGGLAVGFRDNKWSWSLEKHYHHVFTSDKSILDLAVSVGCKYFFERPKTSSFYKGKISQLDSPLNLLKYDDLTIGSRIKTGLALAYLKYVADWKTLENVTAVEWLRRVDPESFEIIWEPLLRGKFGSFADSISAAWFWARIKKRSSNLGYFEGGFTNLAKKAERTGMGWGVEFKYGVGVEGITFRDGEWRVLSAQGEFVFDKLLVTGSGFLLSKVCKQSPDDYRSKLTSFKGIGAVNLVMSLKRQFLVDGSYWLNINERDFPFLAVVEHTNFINKNNYGGDRLVYVGNYLPVEHKYFRMSDIGLFEEYFPYLRRINNDFKKSFLRKCWVFKAPFAQPIVERNYSSKILPFATPLPGLYWASIQQVYPWDRGTNYAVEMGEQVARIIDNDS